MIAERELRLLERAILSGDVAPADADSMRRLVPIDRDICDGILLRLTAFPLNEGTWDVFTGSFAPYAELMQSRDWRPPPLIPLHVVDTLTDAGRRFRRRQSGEPVITGHSTTSAHQRDLAEGIVRELGGHNGDASLPEAGLRIYSKLISARIRDGWVHPAIGAQAWSDGGVHAQSAMKGDRLIEAIHSAGGLYQHWLDDHAKRPALESQIIDLAHSVGWDS